MSWIIVSKETGKPVMETFNERIARAINRERYEVLTTQEWLERLNARIKLADQIRSGDRVTIVDRFGQNRTGKAVMRSAAGGWVLNMGGRYGTPALADETNIVKVTRGRARYTFPGDRA